MTPYIRLPLLIAAAMLAFPLAAAAGDDAFDYDAIAEKTFWEALYPDGGWTLYCGIRFGADRRTEDGANVVIDHVYPTELLLKVAGCDNRSDCRDGGNGRFAKMEADLHNLYPTRQSLFSFRSGRRYGLVEGEDWRFDDCDIEWKDNVFEPRPLARGNVARSIFYMRATYRVPVDAALLRLLKDWNREDPPSEQERARNDQIEKLQGKRNAYVDNPALADRLKPAPPQQE